MRVERIKKFVEEDSSIEWLIEGLLPNVGWTLIVGTQGIGKSTFSIQLCAALQEGKPFLGKVTKQTSILYVQADSHVDEWRAILKRVAPKCDGLTLVDVPGKALGNVMYVEYISNVIQSVKPGFIVFDSLYNLTDKLIGTEAVLLPIGQMRALAGNLPWMLIHHPPHSESRAAGHHSLSANCSNLWVLTKTKLRIDKGRLVGGKELLLSRDALGLWVPFTDTDEDDNDTGDIMNRSIR
jgi:RecA-family ATPase